MTADETIPNQEPHRREVDTGWPARFWAFVDKRDIDKHLVTICILYGTVVVTRWGMAYAEKNVTKAGSEVALVLAAVLAPYMALQAAAIQQYFKART